MTDPNQAAPTTRKDAEASADPAGPLDEDQEALVHEVVVGHDQPLELKIARDDEVGIYDATVGSQQVGGLTFNDVGERVVLVAVSILPQFRDQGAATTLIRHVLDDLRAQGRTATVLCPIVRTFIDKHVEYQDVVDQEHPGVVKVAPR
ncbi:GNAT family N-acetyltransferase [Promicromonospora sp. CA-289599]|uniref:GNAT family N-acetyltransferase n=1 Tax=Promicromonospora sp. CA-289599 TaxID=3240014 RepID=UPI003D8B2E04